MKVARVIQKPDRTFSEDNGFLIDKGKGKDVPGPASVSVFTPPRLCISCLVSANRAMSIANAIRVTSAARNATSDAMLVMA